MLFVETYKEILLTLRSPCFIDSFGHFETFSALSSCRLVGRFRILCFYVIFYLSFKMLIICIIKT